MKRIGFSAACLSAVIALGAGMGLAGAADAQAYGCYSNGYGCGGSMMGPGMMMQPGMMNPGMMGPNGMGQGMMGNGMMMPGMMGQGWTNQQPALNLSGKDVRAYLERRVVINGNTRLKVGSVTERDANTVVADIVTIEKEVLVQRFLFDRKTGALQLSQ